MRYFVRARLKEGRRDALEKAIVDGTLGAGSIAGGGSTDLTDPNADLDRLLGRCHRLGEPGTFRRADVVHHETVSSDTDLVEKIKALLPEAADLEVERLGDLLPEGAVPALEVTVEVGCAVATATLHHTLCAVLGHQLVEPFRHRLEGGSPVAVPTPEDGVAHAGEARARPLVDLATVPPDSDPAHRIHPVLGRLRRSNPAP